MVLVSAAPMGKREWARVHAWAGGLGDLEKEWREGS
jgi:hypothetical protein